MRIARQQEQVFRTRKCNVEKTHRVVVGESFQRLAFLFEKVTDSDLYTRSVVLHSVNTPEDHDRKLKPLRLMDREERDSAFREGIIDVLVLRFAQAEERIEK